jgi:hypothetical protein
VDGRDIRAFTPVFDGLCPAMTDQEIPVKTLLLHASYLAGIIPLGIVREKDSPAGTA